VWGCLGFAQIKRETVSTDAVQVQEPNFSQHQEITKGSKILGFLVNQ
jgi:hypothetical protein